MAIISIDGTSGVEQVQRFTPEAFSDVVDVFELLQIALGNNFLTNEIVHFSQIAIDANQEFNWIVAIEESFKKVGKVFFNEAPADIFPVLYEVFCHRSLGIRGIEVALQQSGAFLSLAREGVLKSDNLQALRAFTLLDFSAEYEDGRVVCTGISIAKNIMTQIKKAALAVNLLLEENPHYEPDAVFEDEINRRALILAKKKKRGLTKGDHVLMRESVRNFFRREITLRTELKLIAAYEKLSPSTPEGG